MGIFSELGDFVAIAKELEQAWGEVKPILAEAASAKTTIMNVVNDIKSITAGSTLSKSQSEASVLAVQAKTLTVSQEGSPTVLDANTGNPEGLTDIPSNPETES